MINSFCGTELAYTNCNKHSITFQIVWDGCYRAGESNREPRIHQAQKPIKLALDTFDYLDAGKTVLDLFGGSGTTLIACEKSKRVCYMMEISPHYCDAIIQRWEKLTGLKAIQEMPV
jgi:DNA modification methylase